MKLGLELFVFFRLWKSSSTSSAAGSKVPSLGSSAQCRGKVFCSLGEAHLLGGLGPVAAMLWLTSLPVNEEVGAPADPDLPIPLTRSGSCRKGKMERPK